MAMVNLVLNGSAEDFLTSIAKNIKAEVDFFFGELRKEGKYDMFKELPPFAQRVTFFQEVGYGSRPYQKYRDAIKSWILYGKDGFSMEEWLTSLSGIKEDAGVRADEIHKFEDKHESSYWRYHDTFGLDFMYLMRKSLIESNPILIDPNIPMDMRQNIFNAALKGNKEYQECQKHFDCFVKKIVSSMISNYLLEDSEVDAYYRQYTRITEKA